MTQMSLASTYKGPRFLAADETVAMVVVTGVPLLC